MFEGYNNNREGIRAYVTVGNLERGNNNSDVYIILILTGVFEFLKKVSFNRFSIQCIVVFIFLLSFLVLSFHLKTRGV